MKILYLLVQHVSIFYMVLGTTFLCWQCLVFLRSISVCYNYTKSKVTVMLYFKYLENSDKLKPVITYKFVSYFLFI